MLSTGPVQSLPEKVLVISLPKSGTYLMSEVLKNLGFSDTKMHLFEDGFSDYSEAGLDDARLSPQKFLRRMPLGDSLNKIQIGEFAVGHLKFSDQCQQLTSGFRRVFLVRELRCSLVSYMRFVHNTGRFGAAQLAWYSLTDPKQRMVGFLEAFGEMFLEQLYRPMIGWLGFEDVLTVRFEDLTGATEQSLPTIDTIASFIGAQSYNAEDVLRAGLSTDTITKSPRHSSLDHFWSDEAEQWFTNEGCHMLNTQLGCTTEATWQRRSVA